MPDGDRLPIGSTASTCIWVVSLHCCRSADLALHRSPVMQGCWIPCRPGDPAVDNGDQDELELQDGPCQKKARTNKTLPAMLARQFGPTSREGHGPLKKMHEHLNWVRRRAAKMKKDAKATGDSQLESRANSIEAARSMLVNHKAASGKIDLLPWLARMKASLQ